LQRQTAALGDPSTVRRYGLESPQYASTETLQRQTADFGLKNARSSQNLSSVSSNSVDTIKYPPHVREKLSNTVQGTDDNEVTTESPGYACVDHPGASPGYEEMNDQHSLSRVPGESYAHADTRAARPSYAELEEMGYASVPRPSYASVNASDYAHLS